MWEMADFPENSAVFPVDSLHCNILRVCLSAHSIMDIEYKNNAAVISGIKCFNLASSCGCGQAFRWRETNGGEWCGIVGGEVVNVKQEGELITISPCSEVSINKWINYFDLERDYETIENGIKGDRTLSVCLPYASGIHVFNQEPFEALESFIISSCNNIKRISNTIEKLCKLCGERIGDKLFAFPTPEAIAALSEKELMDIGTGYRAPYIKKSAQMVADGFDLEKLRGMTIEQARKELLAFPGVGPKVADCVLLFSLSHTDAFPIDVWMGRAMTELYFDSKKPSRRDMAAAVERLGAYSGIIQQYIFHYARYKKLGRSKPDLK